MNTELTRPPNLPETEFIGELQEFASEALAPDDPRLEPRERMGRPPGPRPPTRRREANRRSDDLADRRPPLGGGHSTSPRSSSRRRGS